jgi:hypothetical protein
VTGGLSASLAAALTWSAAAGAVAAEPSQAPHLKAAAAAPADPWWCDDDRDHRYDRDDRADALAGWLATWGLGDDRVRGCDGEWDRCRERPRWPDRQQGGPRGDGRRDDASRSDGTRLAAGAATQTGTAPRGITRGGTCETRDGYTEVTGELVDVPAGGSATSVALCRYGTTAVSGGWSSSEPGLVPAVSQRLDGDSWRVTFDNPTDERISGLAFAYCADDEDRRDRDRDWWDRD